MLIWTLKFSRKKDTFFLSIYLSLKVRAAMRLTVETIDVLEMQNFTSKRQVFPLSPGDGHVIFVSECLILTAVNSSSYGWLILAYITDRIVSIFARSYVTLEIVLHVVYVRAGVRRRHDQIFITKFS